MGRGVKNLTSFVGRQDITKMMDQPFEFQRVGMAGLCFSPEPEFFLFTRNKNQIIFCFDENNQYFLIFFKFYPNFLLKTAG